MLLGCVPAVTTRFTPLRVADEPLEGGLAGVQAGDCLVAFSRAAIYSTRQVGAGSRMHCPGW